MKQRRAREKSYYYANLDEVRRKAREYYHANKEARNTYTKQHRLERIMCDVCKSDYCRDGHSKHIKTKKHLEAIALNNVNNLTFINNI